MLALYVPCREHRIKTVTRTANPLPVSSLSRKLGMERAGQASIRAIPKLNVSGIATAFPDGGRQVSRNGGQASSTALSADCNVIWLPVTARAAGAEAQARDATTGPILSLAQPGVPCGIAYAAGVAVCLGGLAAALPLLAAASAWADPWAISAAFGIAAAIASRAGARVAGSFARDASSVSRAASADLALHDAFTLSLILAASAVLGLGAALLLPAGAVLALAIHRIARSRAASEQDAMLLIVVAMAMAGLCTELGFKECAIAGIALAAVTVMKAGYSCLRLPRRQMWHVWGASALMCAAIAAAGHGLVPLPAALGLPLIAGAIYGAAAGLSSRIFSRTAAKALPAAVPFLSVVAEGVLGSPVHLPQVAAAVLLAAAVAGSRNIPPSPREPAVSAPNAWPMGWL